MRRGSFFKELNMIDQWFFILVAIIIVSGGVKITFGNININNRNKDDDLKKTARFPLFFEGVSSPKK